MSIKEQDPKSRQQQAPPSPPVPLVRHYEVFKNVEDKLHTHLGGLDHDYSVIGMRVAYDEQDSSSEPGVLPYTVEFGYLGPADAASQCAELERPSEEEMLVAMKNAPIPLALLEELRDYSRAEFEEAAGIEVRVGVFVVLMGSPILVYSITCNCANRTREQVCYWDPITKTPVCCCRNNACRA